MRSTRCSKPDMPVSPPNTRSRARARNDGTVPEVVGKRRRGHGAHDGDLDAGDDDLVNDEPAYDDSWHDGRDRSPSRSRSRSLSVIPTSEMPPLTLPAPDDAAVRALGLSQSARPGATALSLEYEHLVRMREGHFTRSRPDPATAPTEGKRNWNELSISEAAWIRLEEVGVINKGRSWTSRVGLDDSGDPVKPDLPYVILTKLVIASSPRKMLTLNQIYQAMEERWPYFRMLGQTFRNSIRHNLSMNPAFINVERPVTEGGVGTGKGGYWRVSEDKTTSHRGRAKKPRVSARAAPTPRRFENTGFAPQAEYQEYYPHQTYQYQALQAPCPAPAHGLQELAQHSPHPSNPQGFAYPGYQQPADGDQPRPKRKKKAANRARRQSSRAKAPEVEAQLPSPAVPSPALPPSALPASPCAPASASASARSSPTTGPVSTSQFPIDPTLALPSAATAPAPSASPLAPTPTPAPAWPRQGYGYGMTLQRAESFVRGSAERAPSPPKLPTPPSEHTGPSALEAFASTALERECGRGRTSLPSIAALLAPLSPNSSPSITPPHPAERAVQSRGRATVAN